MILFIEDHIAWIPQVNAELTDENDITHFERFKNLLDELEDVQDVFHNVILPTNE